MKSPHDQPSYSAAVRRFCHRRCCFRIVQGPFFPATSSAFNFFRTSVWDHLRAVRRAALHLRTLVTATVFSIVAVPLGSALPFFLPSWPPQSFRHFGILHRSLAAVPSVIYGVLGVFIVVPLMRQYIQRPQAFPLRVPPVFQAQPTASGFLTAGIVLPFWSPLYHFRSREVLLSVPARPARSRPLSRPRAGNPRGQWSFLCPRGHFCRFPGPCPGPTSNYGLTMVIGIPHHQRFSLFSGYSIAAVIASEHKPPAIYIRSLDRAWPVLFILTFLLNGFARLLMSPLPSAAADWARNEPWSSLAQICRALSC